MKDLTKLLARRYSSVNVNDDDNQQLAAKQEIPAPNSTKTEYCGAAASAAPATLQTNPVTVLQRASSRRKSLKANRNVRMLDVLGSFFNERQSKRSTRTPKCSFCLLAIGVLAIAAAVLVKIFQPYDLIFKWKLIMAENGEIFNLWAKPPVDLYIKIYLFNITNAEAFLAGREQMRVEQVGPYVYKEIMTHENISFNANNTMSTIPSHPLVWQEHMSEGRREDDEVVMLNIAMLAISHLTAKRPFFVRLALKSLFVTSNSQPIVRMTAKEFMFGFPSSLTTLGNTFLPNWIPFEKVGLIDRMYDFSTDFETFYTGELNPSISGLYETYRGEKNLPQWKGDHCSNIEYASDGTKFKSFLQPNDTVKFFRKSMCRPINLYRVGEERTFGSLKGYNYVFEDNAFDNGVTNEANKCFCRNGDCQPVGLIDVTDCYYGFPISLSYPHFMHGESGLQTNITGMEPDSEKHSSAFVIQPESGLPLSLSVKVQINMHFKDLSSFHQVSRFSYLTAPMLWFEIMMPKLPESLDSRFNFYLNILPVLNPLGFWGGLLLGIALLVYSVTRATLYVSNYARQANNISDNKFARANLLQGFTGVANGNDKDSVYNPCELKLMGDHKQKSLKTHIITRSDEELYSELPQSSFALELEPVLLSGCSSSSGSDCDEGSESDTVTLSRNSTSSSSMEVGDEYLSHLKNDNICEDETSFVIDFDTICDVSLSQNDRRNPADVTNKKASVRFDGSGCVSTSEKNVDRSNTRNWTSSSGADSTETTNKDCKNKYPLRV